MQYAEMVGGYNLKSNLKFMINHNEIVLAFVWFVFGGFFPPMEKILTDVQKSPSFSAQI